MTPDDVADLLQRAIADHRLLDHPFYRRWEAGELSPGELTRYAEQYAHLEACLPQVLGSAVAQLPEGPAKESASATLADELGNPVPHVELFAGFSRAVGARPGVAPSPATEALLETYRGATQQGAVQTLGVLAAYEIQAAEIAVSKADGLRRHYSIDDEGTEFWDLHASLEQTHAGWASEALSSLHMSETGDGGPEADEVARVIEEAAAISARAWWAFLDEREAEVGATAAC